MASTIHTFLGELPDSLLPRIRTGFDALSKLAAVDRRAVVVKFLDSFQRSGDLDRDWLDSTVSISRVESSAILAALSVSVGVLSQTEGTPEDFVQAGRGKLFEDSAVGAAKEAAAIIAGRHDVQLDKVSTDTQIPDLSMARSVAH